MYHSQNRLTNRVLAIVLSLAMTAPLVITDNFATKSKSVKAAETTTVTYGDVNSDNKIDILDLISLKSYVTENNSKNFSVKAADLDNDGIVSAKDAVELSLFLLNQTESFSYEMNIDTDEDGLCDYVEKEILKTDYLKKDTDSDGLDDYAEVYLCNTNPLETDTGKTGVKDPQKDADEDKLTNAEEIKLGTSPTLSDTDEDGINDYDEVKKYKTDPLKSDTDDDGVSDISEIELSLDPLNSKSDGKTDDSEHTFKQEINADSELLKEINSDNSNYSLSISANIAGKLERSLKVDISTRSEYLHNDSISGNIIDIDYDDKLKIDNLRISFDVPDKAEDYFVFKYFEDVNMLLPVETNYDGQTVYTDSPEDGTFCLVDMNKCTDKTDAQQMVYSAGLYGAEKSNEALEVYFLMYVKSTSTDSARTSVATASRTIIDHCNKNNKDVRIYFASYTGNTVVSKETGDSFVSNKSTDEEITEMLSRSGSASGALDTSDFNYSLTRTLKKSLLNVSGTDTKSKKYCFVVDVNFQPQSSPQIAVIDEMKANGVNFSFICNDHNDNINDYDLLSSNGLHYTWSPDFSEIVIQSVLGEQSGIVSYDYATGLFNNVVIPYEITYDWYKAAMGLISEEEVKKLNLPDSDGDGLLDYQEINWNFVKFENGVLILPTFEEICNINETTKQGVKYFQMKCQLKGITFEPASTKVLVLKSSLTSDDSDGDGLLDGTGINKWGLSIKDPNPTLYNKFIGFGTKEYFKEINKISPLNPANKLHYIMEQVNTSTYYDLIPLEYWTDFCEYINNEVHQTIMTEELHFFRLKLNRAPATIAELINESENWDLLSPYKSQLHMYDTDACTDEYGIKKGEYNLKFVSNDGMFEAVYNYNGLLLDNRPSNVSEGHLYDPKNMGTYNYGSPNVKINITGIDFMVNHVFYDIIPYSDDWYGWGLYNVQDEPVDAKGGEENYSKYNHTEENTGAKLHRSEIEKAIKGHLKDIGLIKP